MNQFIALTMCVMMAFSEVPEVSSIGYNECGFQQASEGVDAISIREITNLIDLNSSRVRVEAKYDVNVTPPLTMYYMKMKKGVKYEGTLNLDHVMPRTDAIYAVYIGYIYPVE